MKLDLVEMRRNRRLKELILADSLEELGIVKLVIIAALITCTLFLFLFVWSAVVKVGEVSVAPGTVIPSGKVRPVQHLEGGNVVKINVKNGEQVKIGQPLVTLNSVAAFSELEEMQTKKISLSLDVIRLSAFMKNEKMTVDAIIRESDDIDSENYMDYINMLNSTVKLLHEQYQARNSEREELEYAIEKHEEELIFIEQNLQNLRVQRKLQIELQEIYSELRQSKSVSQLSYIQAKEKQAVIEGEIIQALSSQSSAKNSLRITKSQLDALSATQKEKALHELNDAQGQLLEAKKTITRLTDRVDRLTIRAPVEGIVKGLEIDLGSVVPQGGLICEIVPLDKPLVVEARIDPMDIGHVKIDAEVKIKVTSYNYVNYGSLVGYIQSISASTFVDEEGAPYYQVIVDLEKNYFGDNPEQDKLLPGMVVTADIITGEKTILAYLLKPFHRSLQQAFKER